MAAHEVASSAITHKDLIVTLLSGAVGATIPLVIAPYYNHRRLLYKRMVQHANSLVLLELRLLDIDASLHDNMIALKFIVEGAKKGRVMMSHPVELVLEESFFKDSYVGQLNEKLYKFRYDLRRINKDIQNFNHMYGMLSDAITLKKILGQDYAQQLNGLLVEHKEFLVGMEKLQQQAIGLLEYVRVRQLKDKTWLMRRRNRIIQRRIKTITDEEVHNQAQKHQDDASEDASKNKQ